MPLPCPLGSGCGQKPDRAGAGSMTCVWPGSPYHHGVGEDAGCLHPCPALGLPQFSLSLVLGLPQFPSQSSGLASLPPPPPAASQLHPASVFPLAGAPAAPVQSRGEGSPLHPHFTSPLSSCDPAQWALFLQPPGAGQGQACQGTGVGAAWSSAPQRLPCAREPDGVGEGAGLEPTPPPCPKHVPLRGLQVRSGGMRGGGGKGGVSAAGWE